MKIALNSYLYVNIVNYDPDYEPAYDPNDRNYWHRAFGATLTRILYDDFGRAYAMILDSDPPPYESPVRNPGMLAYGRNTWHIAKHHFEGMVKISSLELYHARLDYDVKRAVDENPKLYDRYKKGYRAATKEWRELYNSFKKENKTFHHYIVHEIPRKLREEIEIKMNLQGVNMGHLKWWNEEDGHWDFPEDPRCMIYPNFKAEFDIPISAEKSCIMRIDPSRKEELALIEKTRRSASTHF